MTSLDEHDPAPTSPRTSFQTDAATAEIRAGEAGELTLCFAGTVDNPRPEPFFEPVFEAFDREAAAETVTHVTLDLTALGFLNSSGIRFIARWLKRRLDTGARGRLTIRYADEVTWQRATIKAFTAMARGAIDVVAI